MSIVEVKQLRVDYDEVTAVNGISFQMEPGKIYGFVGPNGAGKTSTIKALAGVLEPLQGTVVLDGHNLETEREQALKTVGYMPDFPPVYENLKVWEYLDVFATAYGMKREERPAHVRHWIDKVDLGGKRNTLIKELSRGMRQRLVLAKMLEFSPRILFLDEPASGLDPIARKQMRDLLSEACSRGASILISSHILSELQDFADSMIILEKGRIVTAGGIDEIRTKIGGTHKLVLRFSRPGDVPVFEELLDAEGIPREKAVRDRNRYIVHLERSEAGASEFLGKLLSRGVVLAECVLKNDDIEDIFLKIGAKEVA